MKKGGHNKQEKHPSTWTHEDITNAVPRERIEAQKTVETLGMADLLEANKCWEQTPIPTFNEDKTEEDDGDTLDLVDKDMIHEFKATISQFTDDVASGIQSHVLAQHSLQVTQSEYEGLVCHSVNVVMKKCLSRKRMLRENIALIYVEVTNNGRHYTFMNNSCVASVRR